MANLLKVNVTVPSLVDVHGIAHQLKNLSQHLRFENSQIEITVDPDADGVTGDQLAALENSISTLKASSDQLDEAVKKNAPIPPTK